MLVKKYGIILLAAGASSRLGRPKQLLPYGDTTLVQHVLDTAVEASPDQLVLVTGAHRDLVAKSNSFDIAHNAEWQEGIASSIRCGIDAILKNEPALDAVIFIVCDQPYITATLLKELMDAHGATGKQIVASSYSDTVGIPALFGQSFFAALQQLKGDEGAKKIILQNPGSVAIVDFPRGNIDIDTEDEWSAVSSE